MTPGDAADLFGEPDVSGWDVAIAIIVVLAAWFLARLARNGVIRVGGRLGGVSEGMRRGVARATFYFVLLMGIGIALGALGADVRPLQTAAIVGGIVAALALRGVADQFAAGVVLQSTHPYRVGDAIEVLGHTGVVTEIASYSTVIETYDGRRVHVPNAEVASNSIVNRSVGAGLRFEIEVRAASTGDPQGLLDFLAETARNAANVLAQPEPVVYTRAVEPDRLVALVRAWADPALDGSAVAGGLVLDLHRGFRERGIEAAVVTPPPPPPFTPSALV